MMGAAADLFVRLKSAEAHLLYLEDPYRERTPAGIPSARREVYEISRELAQCATPEECEAEVERRVQDGAERSRAIQQVQFIMQTR